MATEQTALAKVAPVHALVHSSLTRDQVDLLKRTIAKGTTDDEFALFIAVANRLGLDPFAKQIYPVKRWDKRENRDVMSIQVGIDGYRAVAMRTGAVDGQDGPFWCGDDGKWTDVWLHDEPPAAAKVIIYRKDCSRPFVGVATHRSYVQTKQDGQPNPMWSRGPDFMLAKCAEALGLRKACPAELGGTITPEEAGNDDVRAEFVPLPSTIAHAPRELPPPAHVADANLATKIAEIAAPKETDTKPEPTTKQGDGPLLAADVEAIGLEMTAAPDLFELTKIGARIAGLQVTDEQRAGLAKIYGACRAQIKKAGGK